ncbi:MAG: corrinoid protein [Candidatus Bathyarchaeota archaeon]|nr:MAG: corrinoid protein [Candidatus Bathyarchaeota archaeon]
MGELRDFQTLIIQISDIEEVKRTARKILETDANPVDVLEVLNEAMREVGNRYERGEYFLSELIMAGVLASEVTEILKPSLAKTDLESQGKIVVGTVKGDIHDIGKNILIMMLSAAGFEVVDLGVDVSAEKFVEAIDKEEADVLGISALLSSTMENLRGVIETIRREGLRDQIKIIVGGRPLTKEFADEIGADSYAKDALEGVRVVKELIEAAEV